MPQVMSSTPPSISAGQVQGRVDGRLKVTGQAVYADDVRLPGMIYGAVLRSPYAHARIRSIDTRAAEAVDGVCAILTGGNIPYGNYGRRVRDIPVLAKDVVRFIGERVVAVAAETLEIANDALALIDVEYEPLAAVFTPEEALAPEAPRVHDAPWSYPNAVVQEGEPSNLQSHHCWQNGSNVDTIIAQSPHVFEHTFHTQTRHQGYLEPHMCVVHPLPDKRLEIWAPNKAPYSLRNQLATWLGVNTESILVHPVFIGGDFGGKGSPMDIPVCIALAQRTGRPVKLRMSYAEDLIGADPRHAATVHVRLGVGDTREITALDVRVLLNGGAYAGFKPIEIVHLNGIREPGSSYRIPAIRVDSHMTYTNTVPRGHARAPGSVQVHFPVERLLDMAAIRLGVDPLEFRRLNMLRQGDIGPLGDQYTEVRSEVVVEAVLDELARRPLPPLPREGDWVRGTGWSLYNRDTHGGVTEVALEPMSDGHLIAWVPFPDQGGGQYTVARNVVSKVVGMPPADVEVRQAELNQLKIDTGVGGSRVTVTASEAFSRAGHALLERLQKFSSSLTDAIATYAAGEPGTWIRSEHDARNIPRLTSFVADVVRVRVDRGTGQVVVEDMLAAVDVANVVNPLSHKVQLEGGLVYGYGEALLEDLGLVEGQVSNTNLGDYKLPSIRDLPPYTVRLVEGGTGIGEQNVKAAGELTNVGVVAAIANAVADATGVAVDSLPITAEQIYFSMHREGGTCFG